MKWKCMDPFVIITTYYIKVLLFWYEQSVHLFIIM
jgi:hypothetical protein